MPHAFCLLFPWSFKLFFLLHPLFRPYGGKGMFQEGAFPHCQGDLPLTNRPSQASPHHTHSTSVSSSLAITCPLTGTRSAAVSRSSKTQLTNGCIFEFGTCQGSSLLLVTQHTCSLLHVAACGHQPTLYVYTVSRGGTCDQLCSAGCYSIERNCLTY